MGDNYREISSHNAKIQTRWLSLVMQCICLLEDLCRGQMIMTVLSSSLNDEYDAYASMTALKKVSTTDVSRGHYPKRLDIRHSI